MQDARAPEVIAAELQPVSKSESVGNTSIPSKVGELKTVAAGTVTLTSPPRKTFRSYYDLFVCRDS